MQKWSQFIFFLSLDESWSQFVMVNISILHIHMIILLLWITILLASWYYATQCKGN